MYITYGTNLEKEARLFYIENQKLLHQNDAKILQKLKKWAFLSILVKVFPFKNLKIFTSFAKTNTCKISYNHL